MQIVCFNLPKTKNNPKKEPTMKIAFDYLRGEPKGGHNGPPIVTECLILDDDGNIGLGRSICSPSDAPCKKNGHFWAKRRAFRALKFRRQCYVKRPEALQRLKEVGATFTEKQVFNPTLTGSQCESLGFPQEPMR